MVLGWCIRKKRGTVRHIGKKEGGGTWFALRNFSVLLRGKSPRAFLDISIYLGRPGWGTLDGLFSGRREEFDLFVDKRERNHLL